MTFYSFVNKIFERSLKSVKQEALIYREFSEKRIKKKYKVLDICKIVRDNSQEIVVYYLS